MTREDISIQKDKIERASKLIDDIDRINVLIASMYDGNLIEIEVWTNGAYADSFHVKFTDPKMAAPIKTMLTELRATYERELEDI